MGKWFLECPEGGVYEGNCTYEKQNGFVLRCPKGLKELEEGCEVGAKKGNPKRRRYLPHGLTKCEKRFKSVRRKLSRCIKELEPREERGEIESAVAVCRASIKCPP